MTAIETLSLQELLCEEGFACECGKVHKTDLKYIDIGRGVISKLPERVRQLGGTHVQLYADGNTWRAAGEQAAALLEQAGIPCEVYCFPQKRVYADAAPVGQAAMHFTHACDLIVGVGTGTVNDICKIMAGLTGRPYIIVGTAPSMDGFASDTSSMVSDGLKISLPSANAKVIIGDTDILAAAPMEMIGAGLGVAGAALGTVLSIGVSGLLLFIALCDKRRAIHLTFEKDNLRPNTRILGNMVRLGVPVALEQFISTSGQVASTRIVSTLGTVAVAANTLAVNAESLSYMPAYGVSVATTTLVGQSIGAGKKDSAMNFGKVANRLGFTAMIFVGVLLFVLSEFLISLFTRDKAVIELGAQMLRIVAVAQPLNASCSILSGALRGAADAKTPFFISVFGMWALRVPLALLFVFVFHWGLAGYWIAMIIDNMTKGALSIYFFRRGKWAENNALSAE